MSYVSFEKWKKKKKKKNENNEKKEKKRNTGCAASNAIIFIAAIS